MRLFNRNYLVIVVLVFLFIFSSYNLFNEIKLRNAVITYTPELINNTEELHPLEIYFPKIQIKVPITSARITNNTWQYSDNSVSYLQETPLPGNSGNSVLYGHNWPNLLGNIKKLDKNDKIEILLSNGETRIFKVEEKYTLYPNETHILNNTTDTRLTIYTCTGYLDSKRLVILAKPI